MGYISLDKQTNIMNKVIKDLILMEQDQFD